MTYRPDGGPAIAIAWECLSNFTRDDAFTARLTLRNIGRDAIASGWTLCFNTCRKILPETVSAGFQSAHLNGDLFSLRMPRGDAWLPGQEYVVEYESLHWAISITDAPLGFYLLDGAGNAFDLGDPEIAPFARPEQRHRMQGDLLPTADAAWRFEQNAALSLLEDDMVGRITPRPRMARFDARSCALRRSTPIDSGAELDNESAFLRSLLATLPEGEGDARILLETDPAMEAEAYRLEIAPERVLVRGADAHGVSNGLQSLAQLLAQDGTLPCGKVLDTPRFAYRGMMLDVARHFSSVDTVLRLLDCMASYKLNRFHFHLTDDEGWRLEIAGLPELTDIGAVRGHAAKPGVRLQPAYGSGPDPKNASGSGYFTRDDYKEILRYAQARHIEVIPEMEMPGHARAAVQAMESRYHRLKAAGDPDYAKYLLNDLEDRSVYNSPQLFGDNVINPGHESSYTFIEHVVAEVVKLHREAGVPLSTIHMGGDELAHGAWEKSPVSAAMMKKHNLETVVDLWDYFYDRVDGILRKHGVFMSGWEELAARQTMLDGRPKLIPNPRFPERGFSAYVWNNTTGNEDLAYRLANAGYDIVLTPVTRMYMDMAHNANPDEHGVNWGAYVELDTVHDFIPLDINKNAPESARIGKDRLTDYGKRRVRGLQANLFVETVLEPSRIDYLVMPRLVAVAERGWAADPAWARENDPAKAQVLHRAAWTGFVNALGQRVLPRLDLDGSKVAYRSAPPGMIEEGGQVKVNHVLPGMVLRYTVDGSMPNASSPVVNGPIAARGTIRAAAFDRNGRMGHVATIERR